MMRKRFLSLTCALVLCLGLLPATALAAAPPENQVIYVGGVVISSTGTGYWTTDDEGNVTAYTGEGTPTDNYIHYDVAKNTLTLHNATIKKGLAYDQNTPAGSTIHGSAIGVLNQSGYAELTVQLEGSNMIDEVSTGIYVHSSGGGAALSIAGNGTLFIDSTFCPIQVISFNGNAALSIENAKVTATSSYYNGVTVQSGNSENSSASLTVNGGSLTATAQSSGVSGIRFVFGSGGSGSGTPNLTVSGNAIVRANGSAGGITSNSSTEVCTAAGTGGSGGIVWNGKNGTVYGDVTLQEDLTIDEDERLTLAENASLSAGGHNVIVDGGTVDDSIKTSLEDIVKYTPTITTTTLTDGAVDTYYSQTLAADGTAPITWSVSGSLPAGLSLNGNTISGTPTAQGESTFTVEAKNDYGNDSKQFTLTIEAAANVPVDRVALSPSTLNLMEDETGTLTATVEPNNASNKSVTWESSNTSVATVDATGKVTAIGAGTATITATAADGSGKTAACTVTVERPYVPPANPNYRIDVTTTEGGTVTKDPAAAKAGETVTLTPAPDAGYEVVDVTVTDRFGDAVEVTEQADGTYTFTMPNGQVSVNVTFVEVQTEPLPFTDVNEGDWFHDAVQYVYDNGLMGGVGDNRFAPNSDTTRAQLVTILHRLAGEPEPGGDSGFSDVAAGTWYTDAVAWAAENGIVNGTTDTTFAPGEDITREQLVTILYRYAESKGYDVSASADLSGYPDAGQVQDYAQPAMAWAVAEGIVEGMDGPLNPTGDATRAQIATILMRFCEGIQP